MLNIEYKYGGDYMDFKIERDNNCLIVSLEGEVDHHNSEIIKDKIDDGIIKYHARNLILDFSSVDFMDSSGIGLILGRYKKISALDGNIYIVDNEKLKRILEMSGIYKIIKIFDSLDKAREYAGR
ncbi:MAG: anti-sigma F factor antagonist [Thermoanaerobacteraceae bacterium]|nr:anti-sigma F factor antagonist [Thermoanaerobacteraceae bacterium]